MKPIYLDYNATTPLDPAARAAMAPFLDEHFGNPSSTHVYGHLAREAVEHARSRVAGLIGAQPDEVIFTSGGTEATNHALKGLVFRALWSTPAHDLQILTTTVEHPATLETCAFLERLGCSVTRIPVDRYGCVEVDAVARALTRRTLVVSIMHANNEVGTIQPIREIAALARSHGALLHVDAAQSAGKISVDVREMNIDLLSLAGHKLYAPKGIGALYVRAGLELESLIHGAGHERGRRAGTENVPYAVALGAACQVAREALPAAAGLRNLRDRLFTRLTQGLGESVVLNGHPEHRLPNTLNVSVAGCVGAELLEAVPEIAASTGSACHEGQVRLSPVLAAMGIPFELGRGAIRLSLGRFTTETEIEDAATLLVSCARRSLRNHHEAAI
jgi:cysteine desulfurase